MKYVVRTMERPYSGGEFKLYTRQMNREKFNLMINMRGFHITPEYSETIVDKNGNPAFMQYGMTFNSSLRHTACRVVSIELDNQLIYQYGNEATKFVDEIFNNELSMLCDIKKEKEQEAAA